MGCARSLSALGLAPITLLSGAEDEARQWLVEHPDETANRINKVMELATGFASAYGLELLATVHWIATREAGILQANDMSNMTQRIRTWSDRKGRLFTEAHVGTAADHLRRLGWMPPA